MSVRNLLDELFLGTISRRDFIEKASLAGTLLGATLTGVAAQTGTKKNPEAAQKPDEEKVVLSPANIGGGGRVERNFYRNWIKTSKVPMIEGYTLYDARAQEVLPWPEIEGRGLYLNFSGNVHMDAVIYEIPEGKPLAQRRQFYEQVIYVLGGRGYTTFGEGSQQNRVEWGPDSLFAVPMNLGHRHYNSDPAHPARLLAITSFPFMLQVFGSLDLIDHLNFDFKDRYNEQPDYYKATKRVRQRWDRTNYVRNIRDAEVVLWEERGEGNASIFWEMAGQTILEPHMSEFPTGTYKLGHRHPYEAIIVTLNGKGFTLTGKDSLKEADSVKLDWKAGSVVSPPYFWYHQHFNVGDSKARYLAMTEGDFPKRLGIPLEVEQIEANQEDPDIKKRFQRALQKGAAQQINGHHHREDHSAIASGSDTLHHDD